MGGNADAGGATGELTTTEYEPGGLKSHCSLKLVILAALSLLQALMQ